MRMIRPAAQPRQIDPIIKRDGIAQAGPGRPRRCPPISRKE
jgi:hypothetical protein